MGSRIAGRENLGHGAGERLAGERINHHGHPIAARQGCQVALGHRHFQAKVLRVFQPQQRPARRSQFPGMDQFLRDQAVERSRHDRVTHARLRGRSIGFRHLVASLRILQFLPRHRILRKEITHPFQVRLCIVRFSFGAGQFGAQVPVVQQDQGLPLLHRRSFPHAHLPHGGLDLAGERGLRDRRYLSCHLHA